MPPITLRGLRHRAAPLAFGGVGREGGLGRTRPRDRPFHAGHVPVGVSGRGESGGASRHAVVARGGARVRVCGRLTHPDGPRGRGCGVFGADVAVSARPCRWVDTGPPRGRAWGAPQGHGMAKCSVRCAPTCTGPCTGEHTKSISGPDPGLAPRLFDLRTPFDLGFCGAPGRIRTCGHRIRSVLVAYRHVTLRTVSCHPIRSAVPSSAVSCRGVSPRSKTAEHERSTRGRIAASNGTSRGSRSAFGR